MQVSYLFIYSFFFGLFELYVYIRCIYIYIVSFKIIRPFLIRVKGACILLLLHKKKVAFIIGGLFRVILLMKSYYHYYLL